MEIKEIIRITKKHIIADVKCLKCGFQERLTILYDSDIPECKKCIKR